MDIKFWAGTKHFGTLRRTRHFDNQSLIVTGPENDETSANNKVKELETEIETLKAKLAASKAGDSELNSGGQNHNVDLDPASFPTQDIEVFPKAVETGIILLMVHIKIKKKEL